MKGFGDLNKSKKKINKKTKFTKEQIINEAFQFHQKGNTLEAAKYYRLFIDRGFTDERAFSNFAHPSGKYYLRGMSSQPLNVPIY